MKTKIRYGVFESNSSSTHSISVMKREDYDKWESGEFYYYKPCNYSWDLEHCYLNENFRPVDKMIYSEDEVKQFLLHNRDIKPEDFEFDKEDSYYESFEDLAYNNDFYSLEKFDYEYETQNEEFVTDDGTKYIVHCAYGYC